jgi:hypothetical protein
MLWEFTSALLLSAFHVKIANGQLSLGTSTTMGPTPAPTYYRNLDEGRVTCERYAKWEGHFFFKERELLGGTTYEGEMYVQLLRESTLVEVFFPNSWWWGIHASPMDCVECYQSADEETRRNSTLLTRECGVECLGSDLVHLIIGLTDISKFDEGWGCFDWPYDVLNPDFYGIPDIVPYKPPSFQGASDERLVVLQPRSQYTDPLTGIVTNSHVYSKFERVNDPINEDITSWQFVYDKLRAGNLTEACFTVTHGPDDLADVSEPVIWWDVLCVPMQQICEELTTEQPTPSPTSRGVPKVDIPPSVCAGRAIDLVFWLDYSYSVTRADGEIDAAKEWISSVINATYAITEAVNEANGDDTAVVRAATVIFGRGQYLLFNFNETGADGISSIEEINELNQLLLDADSPAQNRLGLKGTYTRSAIELALDEVLTVENRPNYDRNLIMIMVTDGNPDPSDTENPCRDSLLMARRINRTGGDFYLATTTEASSGDLNIDPFRCLFGDADNLQDRILPLANYQDLGEVFTTVMNIVWTSVCQVSGVGCEWAMFPTKNVTGLVPVNGDSVLYDDFLSIPFTRWDYEFQLMNPINYTLDDGFDDGQFGEYNGFAWINLVSVWAENLHYCDATINVVIFEEDRSVLLPGGQGVFSEISSGSLEVSSDDWENAKLVYNVTMPDWDPQGARMEYSADGSLRYHMQVYFEFASGSEQTSCMSTNPQTGEALPDVRLPTSNLHGANSMSELVYPGEKVYNTYTPFYNLTVRSTIQDLVIGGKLQDVPLASVCWQQPVIEPTRSPTPKPTTSPTSQTAAPTSSPTEETTSPTYAPTSETASPTVSPTTSPTVSPTQPTQPPTSQTRSPTSETAAPSTPPTSSPTSETQSPTSQTQAPTSETAAPTTPPTTSPTSETSPPTGSPTEETMSPTSSPTSVTSPPTVSPTVSPTSETTSPTTSPTSETESPTTSPTSETSPPTISPTTSPTSVTSSPTSVTAAPTEGTVSPTNNPTTPTQPPTLSPTSVTDSPTTQPTSVTSSPTLSPTVSPTSATAAPTGLTQPPTEGTASPTSSPTGLTQPPTLSPTSVTNSPTSAPTLTSSPTISPSVSPTTETAPPTSITRSPTEETASPTVSPTSETASPTSITLPPTSGTVSPTGSPTEQTLPPTLETASPTSETASPSVSPTRYPTSVTDSPTALPTSETAPPTLSPSASPTFVTESPTVSPTSETRSPSASPTLPQPSTSPTMSPTSETTPPTGAPTSVTAPPTDSPTASPTSETAPPTMFPTQSPTTESEPPTSAPTIPTTSPTQSPTDAPTLVTESPTGSPTEAPTSVTTPPTVSPTDVSSPPTKSPTVGPTRPTTSPSESPTQSPTSQTESPTTSPTEETSPPTSSPTVSPTTETKSPTTSPTSSPTAETAPPTGSPTTLTQAPTSETGAPSEAPTPPTASPTLYPTVAPTRPTTSPTFYPTLSPTRPTASPTGNPTQPTTSPTLNPTLSPTRPTVSPTLYPTVPPTQMTDSPTPFYTAPPTGSPTPCVERDGDTESDLCIPFCPMNETEWSIKFNSTEYDSANDVTYFSYTVTVRAERRLDNGDRYCQWQVNTLPGMRTPRPLSGVELWLDDCCPVYDEEYLRELVKFPQESTIPGAYRLDGVFDDGWRIGLDVQPGMSMRVLLVLEGYVPPTDGATGAALLIGDDQRCSLERESIIVPDICATTPAPTTPIPTPQTYSPTRVWWWRRYTPSPTPRPTWKWMTHSPTYSGQYGDMGEDHVDMHQGSGVCTVQAGLPQLSCGDICENDAAGPFMFVRGNSGFANIDGNTQVDYLAFVQSQDTSGMCGTTQAMTRAWVRLSPCCEATAEELESLGVVVTPEPIKYENGGWLLELDLAPGDFLDVRIKLPELVELIDGDVWMEGEDGLCVNQVIAVPDVCSALAKMGGRSNGGGSVAFPTTEAIMSLSFNMRVPPNDGNSDSVFVDRAAAALSTFVDRAEDLVCRVLRSALEIDSDTVVTCFVEIASSNRTVDQPSSNVKFMSELKWKLVFGHSAADIAVDVTESVKQFHGDAAKWKSAFAPTFANVVNGTSSVDSRIVSYESSAQSKESGDDAVRLKDWILSAKGSTALAFVIVCVALLALGAFAYRSFGKQSRKRAMDGRRSLVDDELVR